MSDEQKNEREPEQPRDENEGEMLGGARYEGTARSRE